MFPSSNIESKNYDFPSLWDLLPNYLPSIQSTSSDEHASRSSSFIFSWMNDWGIFVFMILSLLLAFICCIIDYKLIKHYLPRIHQDDGEINGNRYYPQTINSFIRPVDHEQSNVIPSTQPISINLYPPKYSDLYPNL